MSYETASAATLFSQFHRLVLHEIAAHLPTDILQNLITVIKPNWHLKTELLDVMYMRMSQKDSKYIIYKIPQNKNTKKEQEEEEEKKEKKFLQLHLLSDANLCRVRWVTDLTYGIRKQFPETRALLQYMNNDSEDKEEPSLKEVEKYALSYDGNYSCSIKQALSQEMRRRKYELKWQVIQS